MKKILLSNLALLFSIILLAQSPDAFKYQSIVRDADGLVISDQSVGISLAIHQGSATGTTVYEETFSPSTNQFGLISLEIGKGSVTTGDFSTIDWASDDYFLEVKVDVEGGTNYVSMGTTQFVTVPYAMHSNTADGLTGTNDDDPANEYNTSFGVNGGDLELVDGGSTLSVPLPDIQDTTWVQNGDTIYPNPSVGWMGLGTSSPAYSVDLITTYDNSHRASFHVGATNQSNTGGNFYYPAYFEADATNGSNTALLSENISSSSGTNYGIVSNAFNSSASNLAGSFWGNSGSSSNTSDTWGVYGLGQGNTSGDNFGVQGSASGSTWLNTGTFGRAYGSGTYNVGAEGDATGQATTNYGIFGYAINGTSNNYGGYFVGDVVVTGDLTVNGALSKGSGTFKIDHPEDPENKYLIHSFVESDEMLNVYNGNVTTDANGLATVELPGYFETVNKDFRYQLTVIGVFAQAIVKEKVKDNQFIIQTNQPNVEVSWQVTGVRSDPFADQNRVIPEMEKEEKGTYLHPELYGQPENKSEFFKDYERKLLEPKEPEMHTAKE